MNSLSFSHRPLVLATLLLCCLLAATAGVSGNTRVASLKRQAAQYYYGSDGISRNYNRALELYEAAAKLGDIEANYIAGGMYYTGKGTTKNDPKAYRYLEYAAQNGKRTPGSDRALAEFYLQGYVVPQNFDKAISWYKKAAHGGDPAAQLELGYLYYTGQGTAQDYQQAVKHFRDAAMNNYPMAQYNLAIMWYTGVGTDQSDLVKSYAWFSIAATHEYPAAVSARNFLASRMSSEALQSAQKLAGALYQQIKNHHQ